MRKQLCCQTPSRRVRLGWVSFQPDGSISFGLNDKTYISPKFKARHFVWNAFNRARIHYEVASDPSTLEPVQNPHFTYHPEVWFHLKADGPGSGEALFEAIADVGLTLKQNLEMPWIRATSAPIADLPTSRHRSGNVPVNDLTIRIPTENLSVCMALDFVTPQCGQT